jgi:hypothetical protein
MCRRAGLNQRGVRRLEALSLDPEGSLATTLAGHDAAAIRSAILAAIDLYLDLRRDEPPARPTIGMPMLLWEFMAPAAQAVPAK